MKERDEVINEENLFIRERQVNEKSRCKRKWKFFLEITDKRKNFSIISCINDRVAAEKNLSQSNVSSKLQTSNKSHNYNRKKTYNLEALNVKDRLDTVMIGRELNSTKV